MLRPATLIAISLLLLSILPVATAAQDTDESPLRLAVRGSPLVVERDGARINATVTLAEPADLRLRVVDFDGRTVRELFDARRKAGRFSRTWRGRDANGRVVLNGPYRIVATASGLDGGETVRAEHWVSVAERKVYPRRPEFITVAVDPGHGGSLDGAVAADGTREADLNLDIATRLARMLEGAGIDVVITRSTDGHVNEPPMDRTGDGVVDDTDELAARPDLANTARADLFISVHNNVAVNESVGGPSTFYYDDRRFGDRSARLARIIQDEMVAALGDIDAGSWEPYDHGALIYPYYVLRGYDPPRLRRPTQMPGVLSEGLFLSSDRELRLLKRPMVRQAMAVAYYDAIAKYLARRPSHVGYELLAGPTESVGGEHVSFEVEVRNQGNESMRGQRLVAVAFPAPSRYIGRVRSGLPVGQARIPRLEPGESAVISVDVAAPEPAEGLSAQDWMILFDAWDRDGRRAAHLGSPMLQARITTIRPELSPGPPTVDAEA